MFWLVLIFIVVPLAELYVIIQVGNAIGAVPTILILLFDALLGSFLLRHQGRAAWVRFNRALSENRVPHKEVIDGVLVIFGGALLLTPGFITDVFGLIFLIPPTRAMVRALSIRFAMARLASGQRIAYWSFDRATGRRSRRRRPAPGPAGPPPEGAAGDPFAWEDPVRGRGRTGPRPDDIEGTGHEIRDEDELPPGREPPAR